jgi:hypothetical protein
VLVTCIPLWSEPAQIDSTAQSRSTSPNNANARSKKPNAQNNVAQTSKLGIPSSGASLDIFVDSKNNRVVVRPPESFGEAQDIEIPLKTVKIQKPTAKAMVVTPTSEKKTNKQKYEEASKQKDEVLRSKVSPLWDAPVDAPAEAEAVSNTGSNAPAEAVADTAAKAVDGAASKTPSKTPSDLPDTGGETPAAAEVKLTGDSSADTAAKGTAVDSAATASANAHKADDPQLKPVANIAADKKKQDSSGASSEPSAKSKTPPPHGDAPAPVNTAASDDTLLGKYLNNKASNDSTVVPTGSVLFRIRNLPKEDVDQSDEDIEDVRLMQKLVKDKKAQLRKNAEERAAAASKVAVVATATTKGAEAKKAADAKKGEAPHQNGKALLESAYVKKVAAANDSAQVKIANDAAQINDATQLKRVEPASPPNVNAQDDQFKNTKLQESPHGGAVIAQQVSERDIKKLEEDYSNKFIHVEAAPAIEERPTVKVIDVKAAEDQAPYQVIECDVRDIASVTAKSTENAKFHEHSTYKEMPATVITTSESPTLKFSGSVCSHIGAVVQDDARDNKSGDLHLSIGWADLSWEAVGITVDDFVYRYAASLQVVPGDVKMLDHFVEVANNYGVLQLGNIKGPDGKYADDATWLVGGTGGVDGSIWGLLSNISGLSHTHHVVAHSKRATKLVYNSPRLAGFQFGVGYSPNPKHQGWGDLNEQNYSNSNDNGVYPTDDLNKKHNVAVGVNFSQCLNDCEVCASFVGVTEQAYLTTEVPDSFDAENTYSAGHVASQKREIKLRKDTSYHATWSMRYKNFKIAGGFINNGDQNTLPTKFSADRQSRYGSHLGNAGRVWNIGGKYSIGCVDIGYARHRLERRVTNYDYSKGTIHALSVDCNIVSGVQIFAEIDHIDVCAAKRASVYDESSKPLRNKGTAVLVGSKLSF